MKDHVEKLNVEQLKSRNHMIRKLKIYYRENDGKWIRGRIVRIDDFDKLSAAKLRREYDYIMGDDNTSKVKREVIT